MRGEIFLCARLLQLNYTQIRRSYAHETGSAKFTWFDVIKSDLNGLEIAIRLLIIVG